jgi:hypothetical protein
MTETPKYCSNCGAQLSPGMKFCPSCGHPTSDAVNGVQPGEATFPPQPEDLSGESGAATVTQPSSIPAADEMATVPSDMSMNENTARSGDVRPGDTQPFDPYSESGRWSAPTGSTTPTIVQPVYSGDPNAAAPGGANLPPAGGPPNAAYPASEETPEPPARNKYLIPGLIGAGVLLAACVCIGGILAVNLFSNNRSTSGQVPPTLTVTSAVLVITQTAQPIPTLTLTPTLPPTGTVTEAPTLTVTPTLQPSDTPVPPTATVPAPTATNAPPALPVATQDEASFQYDPSLANQVSGETQDPNRGSDIPTWELHPRTIQFTLQGYPLQNTEQTPRVLVYPRSDFEEISSDAQKEVDRLRDVLQNKPQSVDDRMPFLPFFNASQVFHAQVKYFDHGVRYLTQYAQDVSPISNDKMFYTYQGITADSRYYISVILPVSSGVLPQVGDLSGDAYDAFAANFANYLNDVRGKLNAAGPGDFSPNLDLLDALSQSITVK